MSTLTCGKHVITILQMDNMALKLPSLDFIGLADLDLRANIIVAAV